LKTTTTKKIGKQGSDSTGEEVSGDWVVLGRQEGK
jgi:hypothetical protein